MMLNTAALEFINRVDDMLGELSVPAGLKLNVRVLVDVDSDEIVGTWAVTTDGKGDFDTSRHGDYDCL